MWTTQICALAWVLFVQEHSYSPADIENGARLFQSNCAGCHGTTGDGVPGMSLFRGQFRRATADPDLIDVIRKGIPGTAMPPANLTENQARMIVAYLREMAREPAGVADGVRGDETRGKALFESKGNCLNCHRVNATGKRIAPDLTEVGRLRSPLELQRALLDPSADIRNGNRFIQAVTKDGGTITGRLLNQDTFSLQLIDSHERLISLSKSNLRAWSFVKTSPMPPYRDKFSAQELADIVSYLVSLKGHVR